MQRLLSVLCAQAVPGVVSQLAGSPAMCAWPWHRSPAWCGSTIGCAGGFRRHGLNELVPPASGGVVLGCACWCCEITPAEVHAGVQRRPDMYPGIEGCEELKKIPCAQKRPRAVNASADQ